MPQRNPVDQITDRAADDQRKSQMGHVIDFLLFNTSSWSFAVFNLADSFITLGAASIILDEILDFRRQRSEKSAIEK